MTNASDNIRFQAEHHPIEFTGQFQSVEEYCLHLIHLKAYEEAAASAIDKTVLDLGCNNGYGTAVLAKHSSKIIGLDVSPAVIIDAQQRFGNDGIDFFVYDGRTIPFEDDSFDMVVNFQVIEHISDISPYLGEIARVLRRGGLALFTTPNAAIRLDPGMEPWNQFHVREYRADELLAVLQPLFSKVTIQGLFAIEDLYKVEFERCQGVLKFQRSINSLHFTTREYLRKLAITLAKMLLPARMIGYLRPKRNEGVAAEASKQPIDPSILMRYSTRDIFYRVNDIDNALDLMAICRLS